MCRKLVVTGWVLLVPEDKEQLRVLLAILVSVSFAFFRLTLRPLKMCALLIPTRLLRADRIKLFECGATAVQATALGADDVQRPDARAGVYVRARPQKL